MSKLSISQIQEMNSQIEYLRPEFRSKLWGSQDGDVSFDKMIDFLRNEENRETMLQMIKLAEQLEQS
jgi:hypothetical protein